MGSRFLELNRIQNLLEFLARVETRQNAVNLAGTHGFGGIRAFRITPQPEIAEIAQLHNVPRRQFIGDGGQQGFQHSHCIGSGNGGNLRNALRHLPQSLTPAEGWMGCRARRHCISRSFLPPLAVENRFTVLGKVFLAVVSPRWAEYSTKLIAKTPLIKPKSLRPLEGLSIYHLPITNYQSPFSIHPSSFLLTPPSAPRYSSPAWTHAETHGLRPARDPSNRAAGRSQPTSASCWA